MSLDLKFTDLEYILYGGAFLGAGGGGSIVQGLNIISQIKEEKKSLKLIDQEEISDDELVVVSAGMGSPSTAKFGWKNEHLKSFEILKKYFTNCYKKEIKYIIPLECGAGNFAIPLHTAAYYNLPIINGDGAGRAIPELELTSFEINGIPISPMSISDWQGNGAILLVNNGSVAEILARQIVSSFQGNAGITLYPTVGKVLKNKYIPNTITLARDIGSFFKSMQKNKKIQFEKLEKFIIENLSGYILGEGIVKEKIIETREGFDFGKIIIETNKGILNIYTKNENIIAEQNNKILAMIPDLISIVTYDGIPLTNVDIEKDMKVLVVGLKANEILRKEKSLKYFTKLYKEIGFNNIEYIPIEKNL